MIFVAFVMILKAQKILILGVLLSFLVAGTTSCEKEEAPINEEMTSAAITPKSVPLLYKLVQDFGEQGKLSGDVGIWMHKPSDLSEETISKWLGKKYAPDEDFPKKNLYEPINVVWIDFTTVGLADSRVNVEAFLTANNFFPEGPFSSGIPRHSWGYSAFFDSQGVYPVHQVGETWVDKKWPSENNHGRIFQAANVITDLGTSAFITLGAFSREDKAVLLGIGCPVGIACHDFISFNLARDNLDSKNGWKMLPNPDDSNNLFHFGNEFEYDLATDFWTGNHNGVRIFVLEKEQEPTVEDIGGPGFVFSGIVDSIQVIGDYPLEFLLEEYNFKPGDVFSGTYLFDATIEKSDNFNSAEYIEAITFGEIDFDNSWSGVGTEIRSGPYGHDRIQITNNGHTGTSSSGDSYLVVTTVVDGPNILSSDLHFSSWQKNGRTRSMTLYLEDSTGQVFNSTDLPISLPPLNAFDKTLFTMAFGGLTEPNLWVHGHIESLEERIDP